jgi:hypothetical protein
MGSGHEIPYFDPWDGGIDAEVLFLFEAPGPRAKGSGFISRNNPDETAKNFFEFNKDVISLSRKRTASWNIVPWYIGDGSRIRPATLTDIEAGVRSLNSLLDLLPKLKGIVLFGKKAQRGSDLIAKLRPTVRLFESPHPSPQVVNRSTENKEKICAVLREVAAYLDGVPNA